MIAERRARKDQHWAIVLCIAVAGLSPGAARGEYYSWTDPSGNMVITEDPSRIPPASERSQVVVHRTEDNPASAASLTPPPPSQEATVDNPPPAAINPADLNLPQILLDTPDPSVQSQYNWVPLTSPIYLNSGTVTGFWCLRTVAVPLQAFRQYLQAQGWSGQGSQIMAGQSPWLYGYGRPYRRFWGGYRGWGNPGWGYGGYYGGYRSRWYSGHPVYDQVMMERRIMNRQLSARFGAAMQRHPYCCAGGFSHGGGFGFRGGRR